MTQLGLDFGPPAAKPARRSVAPERARPAVTNPRPTEVALSRSGAASQSWTPPSPAPRVQPPKRAESLGVLSSTDDALGRGRALTAHIAAVLGEPVRVVFTDNRRTMLSAKRRAGRLEVRLHHMFLAADERVVDAVARYLGGRSDRAASRSIDDFIEDNRDAIRETRRRRIRLRTAGVHHDLHVIMHDIIGRHFGAFEDDVRITWGRRVKGGRHRRSIQLGTYLPDEQLIRIHPVLDQDWVPRFYVEAVVFHELLHHDLGAEVHNGKRCFHTPTFRARERAFEFFAPAQAWEKAHLSRLLRS